MTVRDALDRGMRAQLDGLRARLTAGVPRAGWKIGINDPEVQRRFGLERPVVGSVAGDKVLTSGASYVLAPDALAMVEAEIAIRLVRAVPAGTAGEDVRAAVAALVPAIEIVDYRRPSENLAAILEHSIFHEATVLGVAREGALSYPLDLELPRVFKNGSLAREAQAALHSGDLEEVVRHVADTLARYDERLEAGDLILSGSFTRPLAVAAGDRVAVEFGPLGRVELQLAPEATVPSGSPVASPSR